MFWIACIITYILSYVFAAFAFPQIIGSIRMIAQGVTKPFVFTLILWTFIFIGITLLAYFYLSNYFAMYLVALILPFIFTIKTKNME